MKEVVEQLCKGVEEFERISETRWWRIEERTRSGAVTAYCDCSYRGNGCFGLGVCLVTVDGYHVHAQQYVDETRGQNVVWGEMRAVQFAAESVGHLLQQGTKASKVLVLSDLQFVGRLIYSLPHNKYPVFYGILDGIDKAIDELRREHSIDIHVSYLDPVGQMGNPFYQAAHQSARWVATLALPGAISLQLPVGTVFS